jgi:uncharacterized membrane protein YdfJ with MMPL/SSD domain
MDRLGGLNRRKRRLVLLVWGLAFIAAVPLSLRQTDRLTEGGFEVPGSDSFQVDRDTGRAGTANAAVVLAPAGGTSRTAVQATAVRVRRVAAAVPGVDLVSAKPSPVSRARARDDVLIPLALAGGFDRRVDVASNLRKDLVRAAEGNPGVAVHLVGQDALWAALHDLQKEDLTAAERVGFPITLLILLAVFGALAAAALPFALGAVSVTLTGAAVYFLSRMTDMSVFVTNAASMLGIGVAIDYSLFVLARYRQHVREGASEEEARRAALQTSGLAVVFSGTTVVVALLGIFLVDSTLMRSLALGVIVVVAISVLGAVTLLPSLIAVFGRRVYARGPIRAALDRAGRGRRRERRRRDFWTRWTEAVMRRPLLSVVAASAFMLVLAIPALSIDLNDSALGQFPKGDETRVAAAAAARTLGPGGLAPIEGVATFREGGARNARNRSALSRYLATVRKRRGVASATAVQRSGDRRRVAFTITPVSASDRAPARTLLREVRQEAADGRGLARVADVRFGGPTALTEDFVALVRHSMWKIALFVVVASFLILVLMLRSIVLPLKAVFMTLLSVATAYGVLVAIFQWGWLDGILGYDSPGYVSAIVPALLLATVFGLSMDYEVFLLSRIREFRETEAGDREAVALGLRASAGTISSAALIMVSVFAVFAAVAVPSIQEVGVGLAVAIALDATVVRLILVPATMELLGRWNWWFPAFMERRVPRLGFETVGASGPVPTTPVAAVGHDATGDA